MARLTGGVCKLCRREGMKLFLKGQRCFSEKCGINRRDYPPGMHTRPRKTTDYSMQLREKQKAKRIYGVLERQFRNYFKEAVRQKGNTGENLLVLLERRIDNVVLNLGLARSRFDARQMIAHGHVQVNGRRCDVPSYLVRVGDSIKVAGKEKVRKKVQEAIEINKGQAMPAWLDANPSEMGGKVVQLPQRGDVPHPIDEQLIIELCSR
ncbi:MAG: 30S ribosomal protein S4 [Planctomycetes bacterium]|nr:30S ribosomal protein S4 [Planctomycetota bacterium]MCB9871659.1 30S ribosomal protein S4 [Planctomycetota bacterium]